MTLDALNDTDTLAPCPHCGAAADFVSSEDEDGRFVAVQCTNCGCGGGKHYPLKDDARPNAANEWNRRSQSNGQPFAYMSKGGIRNWLQGDSAESHVLMRKGGENRLPLYLRETEEAQTPDGPPIAVRPLTWVKAAALPDGTQPGGDIVEILQGIALGVPLALIVQFADGTVRMGGLGASATFPTLEAAKEAANAGYVKEILSIVDADGGAKQASSRGGAHVA